VLTFALPRAGWIAAAVAVIVLVAGESPSTAGLLAAAAFAVPLAALGAPRAWSLPAAAPLLGLVSLAGAYPALAGRARRWHARAGLGAAGAWWLLLAAPLGEPGLLLDTGEAFRPEAAVLVALWAAAAVVLPWLVRNRHLTLDVVAAVSWAAGLAAATGSITTWMGLPEPNGLVGGAVAAALVAVWPRH
jgi:hypothetical protein